MRPNPPASVVTYTYAREQGDFHAANIRMGNGEIRFDLVSPLGSITDVELGVPVGINIENGIAAMALAQLAGLTPEEIRRGMASFRGVDDFTYNSYSASLNVSQTITPDSKVPKATGTHMKSGYGFGTSVVSQIETNAPMTAYTQAQSSVMYFPEFDYLTYFRVLDKNVENYKSTFRFKENRFSSYRSRVHFTPVWYPDGVYKAYAKTYDAWTPAGMLSVNLSPSLVVGGNLFDDWHIAPKKQ